jgi:hypothetical protein
MVKRLLDANASDFAAMNARDLAESIRAAEGRTLAAEVICTSEPPVEGISHGELAAAMSADIIVLDGFDPHAPIIRGAPTLGDTPLTTYKRLLGRPIGINMIVADPIQSMTLGGRLVSETNIYTAAAQGVDMVFLYVRPKQGGTAAMQANAARKIKQQYSEHLLLVGVPSFSKPAPRDANGIADFQREISALVNAGCEAVAFPMPGSKQGWQFAHTAQLIDFTHAHGALVWLFITGSVEGAGTATMSDLALLGKQLGADAFRLDEAGLSGMTPPENILAFSLALRGARHTYRRMASSILR